MLIRKRAVKYDRLPLSRISMLNALKLSLSLKGRGLYVHFNKK